MDEVKDEFRYEVQVKGVEAVDEVTEEVEEKRQEIVAILGDALRASDTLYSTRILKKTGLRLRKKGD